MAQTNGNSFAVQADNEQAVDELTGDLAGACFMLRFVAAANGLGISNVADTNIFASGKINEVEANFILIDSGSTSSLISAKLWEACRRTNDKLVKVAGRIVAANNAALRIAGLTHITVKIAGLEVRHPVLVAVDLGHHCILGIDFLRQHKCDLLITIGQLVSPAGSTALRYVQNTTPNTHALTSLHH